MKTILILAVLALSACGGGGSAGSAAAPTTAQPGFVAPIADDGGGQVPVIPTTVAVTYYSLARTEAPVNGWSNKTYTATGSCATINSKVFCWDDGVKTLQWRDFNNVNYGPYTYTYFGYDISSGGAWGSCHGGCAISTYTDLFANPRYISPTLATNLGNAPVNNVFTNGTPTTVTCSVSGAILSCGTFTIDTNQAAL